MAEHEEYACRKCQKRMAQQAIGTRNRNHCPHCLWSLHVAKTRAQDDRESDCHGLMEPIAISTQRDGEWSIVHRCQKCNVIKTNRIAGDDDSLQLLCLALRPLANMPFPVDQIPMEALARYRSLPRS
jgi:DNA-directed RNA polymerase subunit RPC12/RpoP